ncbi:hypothetical protein POKO110462_18845 [Pontibacter korlensis]
MHSLLCGAILSLLFQTNTSAQQLSKLEVGQKETYVVAGNVLQVDTLILHDKATLKFPSGQQSSLKVAHAVIGQQCTITAAGQDGSPGRLNNNGGDGQDAGHLHLEMHLAKLGSLTIDTRGGKGGNGYVGKNGMKASAPLNAPRTRTSGEIGTAPGVGGNGGNVTLYYSTSGFTPIFNHKVAPQRINIFYQAGVVGANGRDGTSYYKDDRGRPGLSYSPRSKDHIDGKVQIERVDASVNSGPF